MYLIYIGAKLFFGQLSDVMKRPTLQMTLYRHFYRAEQEVLVS